MKRDATIAIVAAAAIAALCYGLAAIRPPFQPTKSTPFRTGPAEARVVIRVNGEPVTESEYAAAFNQVPDEMKPQFESGPGKQAFAEQLVRLKILEQEAHRLGIDNDPNVQGQIAADRMNIVARAAAEKVAGNPTPRAVEAFYQSNRNRFDTIDLSHIVIAYEGGGIRPRNGQKAPTEVEAMNRANEIYRRLKTGANFEVLALNNSDDVPSARQGGNLGGVGHGMLPRELEDRVWAIPTGQISEPIASPLGVHIFRVNARGTAPLRDVSASISQHVRQQQILDRVEALRRAAKVEFDPKFFPSTKATPKKPS